MFLMFLTEATLGTRNDSLFLIPSFRLPRRGIVLRSYEGKMDMGDSGGVDAGVLSCETCFSGVDSEIGAGVGFAVVSEAGAAGVGSRVDSKIGAGVGFAVESKVGAARMGSGVDSEISAGVGFGVGSEVGTAEIGSRVVSRVDSEIGASGVGS